MSNMYDEYSIRYSKQPARAAEVGDGGCSRSAAEGRCTRRARSMIFLALSAARSMIFLALSAARSMIFLALSAARPS